MLSSLAPQDDVSNSYLQSRLSHYACHHDLTWVNHHAFGSPLHEELVFLASRVPSSPIHSEKDP